MMAKDCFGKFWWFLPLVFLVLVFSAPVCRGDDLTFSDALEKLQQTSESLKAARAEVKQRNSERDAAKGLYFPKIQAAATYTRIDEPITIDLNDIRTVILQLHPNVPPARIPSFDMTVQNEDVRRALVSATWPIFTGGQILAANRAAEAFVKDAREKERATRSILASELARRYFGVRLTRSVIKLREEDLEGLNRHLNDAKKMEEAGMTAHVETLHAEVAQAEADRALKSARRDEELARTALDNIIEGSRDAEPTTPLFITRRIEPLDHFRSLVLQRSPLLKQVSAQKEAAHQAYKKEVGSLAPQIFLFGERALDTKDLTIVEPAWAVGVGIKIPLFEGGMRVNRVASAKAVEEKVGYMEAQAKRDLETLVEKRYQQLMKAIEQYDALGPATASAEEYLRVRTRSFEEGYATSLDVVDARLAVTRAKTGKVLAAYDADTALAELLDAAGAIELFEEYRARAEIEVTF
jgi:outer membrane protein TolC